MEKIKIYTDGACNVQHEKRPGGWGVVLLYGEHRKEMHGGEVMTTNNRMELVSVIEGLKIIKDKTKDVEVYSDSAYVCNAINKGWLPNWQKKGWVNSSKKKVENIDLWECLIEEMSEYNSVEFIKVKGHTDNENNNRADELAVMGKNQALDNIDNKNIIPNKKIYKIINDLCALSKEDLDVDFDNITKEDKAKISEILRRIIHE